MVPSCRGSVNLHLESENCKINVKPERKEGVGTADSSPRAAMQAHRAPYYRSRRVNL
jgi:hypothetical protein